jgi:hypothetical protein
MALCTPVNPGAIWFQTNTLDSYWWDGTTWQPFGGGVGPASCFVCDVTNTYGGDGAFINHTADENGTAVGYNALTDNTSGARNTAVGSGAAQNNTTASDNVAIGYNSLSANTTGYKNIAIGSSALYSNTDTNGRDNVAIGIESLYTNTTGRSNIAIGNYALRYSDGVNANVAIGVSTLYTNKSGAGNTGVGANALYNNYDGDGNVGVGLQALEAHTSGEYNIAIGYQPMLLAEVGDNNISIGHQSLEQYTLGDYNIAIGHQALLLSSAGGNHIVNFSDYSGTVPGTVAIHDHGHGLPVGVTTNIRISNSINYDGVVSVTWIDVNNFYFTHAWLGNDSTTNYCWWSYDLRARHNIGIGCYAGYEIMSGSDNTFLGHQSGWDGLQKDDAINSMALGSNSYTTKDNQVVLGDILITETLMRGITGVNEVTIAAQLDVCQSNNAGAIPVLELDQDDQDESFINYVGTSAADQTKSISTINGDGTVTGPKNFSASPGWEYVGMVKVDINGSAYWMPYYQPDLA